MTKSDREMVCGGLLTTGYLVYEMALLAEIENEA